MLYCYSNNAIKQYCKQYCDIVNIVKQYCLQWQQLYCKQYCLHCKNIVAIINNIFGHNIVSNSRMLLQFHCNNA